MALPSAQLAPLDKADGSATYAHNNYNVLCAVNGPIEVQRRAELPERAALEINVRPAIGIGGPRERHLETLVHNTLRHVLLARMHPRTLIQITLQVLAVPEDEHVLRRASYVCCVLAQTPPITSFVNTIYVKWETDSFQHLSILPALLQACNLALIAACIPMQSTLTATCIAITSSTDSDSEGTRIVDPSPTRLASATSAHVFAFSSTGDLLLAESEGRFDMDEWEDVYTDARAVCCTRQDEQTMQIDGRDDAKNECLQGFVETVVRDHVRASRAWTDAVPG